MALQGSLETVGLPDVLTLLGRAAKTGRLSIDGARQSGAIGFRDGQITTISTGRAVPCVDTVDALFDLLRIDVGTFAFDSNVLAPAELDSVDVEATLVAAQSRLVEWRSIEAVVGSIDATVELVGGAVGPVTVSPEQWDMVIAIQGASQVGAALQRRAVSEFDGCKIIKALVDAGFARIAAPPEAPLPVVTLPGSDIPVMTTPPEPGGSGTFGVDPTPAGASGPWWDAAVLPGPEPVVELDFGLDPAVNSPDVQAPDAEAGTDAEAGPEQYPGAQVDPVASDIVATSSENPALGDTPDATPVAPRDEPLNRGLLLKFLSSVRT